MRKRRWLKRILLLALVLIVLPVATYLIIREIRFARHERMLAEAIAEADRTDPHWRLEDLDKDREEIPPERNAYLRVQEVRALIGKDFRRPERKQPLPGRFSREILDGVAPNQHLTADDLEKIDECLRPYAKAIELAHSLADMTEGRRPPDDEAFDFRTYYVWWLLELDILRCLEKNDVNGALRDVRAMLSIAESTADEPSLPDQVHRIQICRLAAEMLEKVIALSEPGQTLANLPLVLKKTTRNNLLTLGIRGERAWTHSAFQSIENSRVTLADALDGDLKAYRERPDVVRDHANTLEWFNRLFELSKLPLHQQPEGFAALGPKPKVSNYQTVLIIDYDKPLAATQRHHAKMECARVAIAVELFRVARGRWPLSLSEVPKELLPEIPLDPFDGNPLRFRRTDYGVVVYSVGDNLKDDDGVLDGKDESGQNPPDVGFRLWDPEMRRWPPPNFP